MVNYAIIVDIYFLISIFVSCATILESFNSVALISSEKIEFEIALRKNCDSQCLLSDQGKMRHFYHFFKSYANLEVLNKLLSTFSNSRPEVWISKVHGSEDILNNVAANVCTVTVLLTI